MGGALPGRWFARKAVRPGHSATEKLRVTGGAPEYVLLPVCEAWIEQVPAERNEADVPETVHTPGVVDAKPTASPELAVAESVRGVPTVCAGMAPKVMV